MTTKLDIPKNKGELTYSNNGSCGRLINYQVSNKEKLGEENEFFTLKDDKITKEQAKNLIDNNVKGLKKDDEKFYSFSINPSNDELDHIKNDKAKIKDYTREVMSNYAKNLKDKGLSNKDLVWTAIVHDTRYYTHEDVKKANLAKENVNFKVGEKKAGNNMHIHVIVSRKDSTMSKTLTIRGRKGKDNFSLFEFQKMNQDSFQSQQKYKEGVNLYGEMQTKAILENVYKIGNKMPLDSKEVLKIAEKYNYSGSINYNIKDLDKSIRRGETINDPYKFIEVGKKQYNKDIKEGRGAEKGIDNNRGIDDILGVFVSLNTSENNKGEIPDISDYNRKKRKKKLKF